MKRNGFTMVELLATIVILSVIMMIAVPSVIGILNKNKKDTMLNDAKKFLSLAEAQAKKDNYTCSCYTLNQDKNYACNTNCNIVTQDIDKSPWDNNYSSTSKVEVVRVENNNNVSYYFKVFLSNGNKKISGVTKNNSNSRCDINDTTDNRYNFVVDVDETSECE